MNSPLTDQLFQMRKYFSGYATYSYEFRIQQLRTLKAAILRYEKEIQDALYADLKKSPEESWVTETGFLVAEISHTLKKLSRWMRPEKVGTNLLNFPSSSYIYKEPLGVVLITAPWNYPLQLLLTPVAGAIAAGNCIVIKPSEFAPATSALVKKLIKENFQKEFIFCVEGEGASLIPEMMEQFRFDHVFYTGSTEVGRKVYELAAKKLVPVTLELGGKSPCVVDDDADIRVSARRIALTKFSNAGQMCVAPDYLLVHRSIKQPFLEALKDSIEKFYTKDAASCYNYGKMINEKHFNRVMQYMQEGNVIYGGKSDAKTNFIGPAIIENLPLNSRVMSEEIFGPVLPVFEFETFEEAKEIIERNPNPLAFYVFTQNKRKEKNWLQKIAFGGGCVNNASWHLTNFNLPFGGRGNSGMGAYHGKFSFETFSHRKAVMKTPTWFDPSIKYPPFKGKLGLFKKIIR